jgi:hypothetical protein
MARAHTVPASRPCKSEWRRIAGGNGAESEAMARSARMGETDWSRRKSLGAYQAPASPPIYACDTSMCDSVTWSAGIPTGD